MVLKVGVGKKTGFWIHEDKSDFDKSCGGQMKIGNALLRASRRPSAPVYRGPRRPEQPN